MLSDLVKKQIKDVLKLGIECKELAGGNLLILKEGKEIFYHEDGFANLEEAKPIKRDTIFRLYSMTKPITATAIMILLERGLIDLYEPVCKYLKGFENQMVADGNKIVPVMRDMNIKDLLSMTGGLVYDGNNKAGLDTVSLFQEIDKRLLSSNPMTTLEAMNSLGSCALAFQPGTSWQYGTSADVLGAIVEVVSGVRFGEFLSKELFIPLGMKDTCFWVPDEKRERLVTTYQQYNDNDLIPYYGNHLGINQKMDRDPAFESGGAGLVSTIDDYAKFATMLMNNGVYEGVGLLKPKTVKYLTTATLHDSQQKSFHMWHTLSGHSYGNLMRVMTDESKVGDLGMQGEYGWDGWLGAYFCNCPKENITILFMMQKTDSGTTNLTRKLRNIILSSY